MSHELRTPLNAIIGFSDLMRTGVFGPIGEPRYGEYLNDIHASAESLLGLINDILDTAKIDSGKMELFEEPVDLEAQVTAALRIVSPRAFPPASSYRQRFARFCPACSPIVVPFGRCC
jgi:two-component system cell cycle sensor histidine kinase PleC